MLVKVWYNVVGGKAPINGIQASTIHIEKNDEQVVKDALLVFLNPFLVDGVHIGILHTVEVE